MNRYITFLLFCILFNNILGNFPKNSKKIYPTKKAKFYKNSIKKQRKFFNTNKKNNSIKKDNNSSIFSKIPENALSNINANYNVNQNENKTETLAAKYVKNRHRGKKLFSTEVIIGLVVVAVVLVFGSIILALILRKYQNKPAVEDTAKTVVKLQTVENDNKVNNKA